MKTAGRPPLSKKLKKVILGFTVSPKTKSKIGKVKGHKSLFIEAVLSAIPDDMIKKYNSDPEKFIANAQASSLHMSGSKFI
jgi:ABC-type hemin transport system substrate-binding protein